MFQSISIFAALAGFDRKESIGIITILAAIEKKPIPLFKFIGMTILFAVRIRVCGGGEWPFRLHGPVPDCFRHSAEGISKQTQGWYLRKNNCFPCKVSCLDGFIG